MNMKTTTFESSAHEHGQDHPGATSRAAHEHGRDRESAAVRRGEPSSAGLEEASAALAAAAAAAQAPATRPAAAARFATLVAQARADSPLGGLLLAATANGLAGVWFDGQKHHPGVLQAPVDAKQRWIDQALAELDAYWQGKQVASALFRVPLDPQGSAFQREVWLALRAIPHGRTLSYGALAGRLGRGPAVRAVAGAVGRNPLSVIVPCHRVIGAAGALTGYAGGLHRKRALLALEGAAA